MKTLGKTLIIFLPFLIIIIPFSCKDKYPEGNNTANFQNMKVDNLDTSAKLNTAKEVNSPISIKFEDIPVNVDITSENEKLYADSCADLVVIDILEANNLQNSGNVDVFGNYKLMN